MPSLLRGPINPFEPYRVIAQDGSQIDPATDLDTDAHIEKLEKLLRAMLRARRFDERMLRLQRQGEIGTFAPVKGQEAAQVGAAACLGGDDWLVPSFRETAAALHRGMDMADILLAAAGWNEGAAMLEDARTLPDTVPVASQLPIAVGMAMAARGRGEGSVVMACFGDGATSGGDFHEAMNFAAVFGAPVVFLCQNNGWAISTPRKAQTVSKSLAQKAHGYGMPAAQVDGNDLLAVLQVMEAAVSHVRETGTPVMIEAVTYRMEVHTTADDPGLYRDEDDVDDWAALDPIERMKAFLEKRSQLDDGILESLETEIELEIDDAWERAQSRMDELRDMSGTAIFDHLYADLTRPLQRQRKAFEALEKEGLIG